MKKVSIYLLSLFIGLIIGVLLYTLIRSIEPKNKEEKLDYITYNEIASNLNMINIKYGQNIKEDEPFKNLISNAFNEIDLSNYIKDEDGCSFYECVSKANSFTIDIDDIEKYMKKIYGVDRKYSYDDFKYDNGKYKGECLINNLEKNYRCSLSKSDTEFNDTNYKIIKAVYKEDEIILRSYVYYKENASNNMIKIYSDENLNNLVATCKESELDIYLLKVNLVDIVYKKNSDNTYYLKKLTW